MVHKKKEMKTTTTYRLVIWFVHHIQPHKLTEKYGVKQYGKLPHRKVTSMNENMNSNMFMTLLGSQKVVAVISSCILSCQENDMGA
jgi:hypothetical protein